MAFLPRGFPPPVCDDPIVLEDSILLEVGFGRDPLGRVCRLLGRQGADRFDEATPGGGLGVAHLLLLALPEAMLDRRVDAVSCDNFLELTFAPGPPGCPNKGEECCGDGGGGACVEFMTSPVTVARRFEDCAKDAGGRGDEFLEVVTIFFVLIGLFGG